MFMTADCVKWVETTKNNFESGWGTAGVEGLLGFTMAKAYSVSIS